MRPSPRFTFPPQDSNTRQFFLFVKAGIPRHLSLGAQGGSLVSGEMSWSMLMDAVTELSAFFSWGELSLFRD